MKYFRILFLVCLGLWSIHSQTNLKEISRNAQWYKDRGDEEKSAGKVLMALESYRTSIRKNPDYVPALLSAGSLLRNNGALEEAGKFLEKAYKLEPQSSEILFELAENFMLLGNVNKAEELLQEGLKREPHNADLNYLLARKQFLTGRLSLARKKSESIIQKNPGHLSALLLLSQVHSIQNNFTKADWFLEKASLVKPEDPEILLVRAQNKLRQITSAHNDLLFNEAITPDFFQEPLELLMNARGYENQAVNVNYRLAQIYAYSQRCDQANEFITSALSVNPQHVQALYLSGYCHAPASLRLYPGLIKRDNTNEVIRHRYEQNLLKLNTRRENKDIVYQAREHFRRGKELLTENKLHQAILEIRWSLNLFPAFIEAREHLLDHYRVQRDMVAFEKTLIHLKKITGKETYNDMHEQLVSERAQTISRKYSITRPLDIKNPNPVFIFHLQPADPWGAYPDAGKSFAEKLNFQLEENGKVYPLDRNTREKLSGILQSNGYFGSGGYYSGRTATQVKEFVNEKIEAENQETLLPYSRNSLRFFISGYYREIAQGLSVRLVLTEADSGIRIAETEFSQTGRGYLDKLVLQAEEFLIAKIPFSGNVVKIDGDTVLVNLGSRDGLKADTPLMIARMSEKVTDLKIVELETDLLIARIVQSEVSPRIKPGDMVYPGKK